MSSDMIGKTFGSYKLVGQLGQGGMASVYRGYQEAIDRSVAIKIMPAELLHDPNFIKRFINEARTLAKLSHPNILPLYDFGEANGAPHIIMPLMAGGTLVDRIRRGPMSPAEVVRILVPIADALDYAHSQGLLHRDIKPNNILFDARDHPVLADFGIAKYLESASNLTGTGIIGTPDYMSPEQARGEQLDRRADVYSLAVVAYQMFTGQSLFKATTPMGVIFKHVSEAPRPIRELRPDAPSAVEAVVMKSLAKSPADRHQTASEFARALAVAAEPATRPVPPSSAPTVKPAPPATAAATRIESYRPVTSQPQPQKRSGMGTWLIVGGIVVVVGLCVFFGLAGVGGLGILGLGSAAATDEAATAAAVEQTRLAETAIAEETRVAQLSADATATAVAQQPWLAWPVIYSEDFVGDKGYWDTSKYTDDYATVDQQITDGVYRWKLTAIQGVNQKSFVSIEPENDLYISVDAHRVSGPTGSGYGLVFRWDSAAVAFYSFAITDLGSYSFQVFQNREWATLIDWTESDAIRPGEWNRITVVVEGAHFAFFINDEPVGEYDDSRIQRGGFGLGMDLFNAGDRATLEFDNFVVRSP